MSAGPPIRYIASEIYRASRYGSKHPLSIPRVSTTTDLIRAMGWLDEASYIDGPVAQPEELIRFHDPAYIAALRAAEREQDLPPEQRVRFGIGRNGNPIYGEVFRRPATAAGSSMLAAELLSSDRARVIHSPAGGTHHGQRDRASGFCYLNDPVLGILRLLDRGLARVAYVDLDAHHGDGVEAAFSDEPRVLTISIHEAGRWPHSGALHDRAGGFARNLPVPPGFHDDELRLLIEGAVLPLLDAFGPDALVIQAGCDGLADDPLSRLALSNRALWDAVATLRSAAPRLLVLGGGGYNPWAVPRCWGGIWAVLNGFDIPARLPDAACAVLADLTWSRSQGRNPPEHWLTTMADPRAGGPIRPEIRAMIPVVLAGLEELS
jgi:acetoin utilization protein AcuC